MPASDTPPLVSHVHSTDVLSAVLHRGINSCSRSNSCTSSPALAFLPPFDAFSGSALLVPDEEACPLAIVSTLKLASASLQRA